MHSFCIYRSLLLVECPFYLLMDVELTHLKYQAALYVFGSMCALLHTLYPLYHIYLLSGGLYVFVSIVGRLCFFFPALYPLYLSVLLTDSLAIYQHLLYGIFTF